MPERSRETYSDHAVPVRAGARGGPKVTRRASFGEDDGPRPVHENPVIGVELIIHGIRSLQLF